MKKSTDNLLTTAIKVFLRSGLVFLLAGCGNASKGETALKVTPSTVVKESKLEEPDWMPHPDKPRKLSAEELAFIKKCADNEHLEFDPERNLLLSGRNDPKRSLSDKNSQGRKEGSIRWSIAYATVLFDSGDEAHQKRALKILEATLPHQHVHPGCKYHGNWPKTVEVPIDSGGHVDVNQADFIAIMLQGILFRHGDILSEEMKEKIKRAQLLSAEYILSRHRTPSTTNPYIMGVVNLLAIGERYDRPDIAEKGLDNLRKFHELLMDQKSYREYQSPNYTLGVSLGAIYNILKWVKNPEARSLALDCYNETWRQLATQYHPPSQQMAGPQLRNRGGQEILSQEKSQIIRRAVEGVDGPLPDSIRPSRKTAGLVHKHYRVPDNLKHFFTELPEARQVVQSYWSMTPISKKYVSEKNMQVLSIDTIGTTFLHPEFALGTVNRGHFAPDRRGIMAHWGTPEKTGCMIINFYKNGIPFCAPQHFGVQDKERVLYAANFSTNGGDTHWFFDRIKGSFKAKDLRLRIQFMGIGKEAQITIVDKERRIAEVTSGKITFRIHVPVAEFNGHPVKLEKGKMRDSRTVDIVFHKGPNTNFNLKKFRDSAVGIALAVDTGNNKTSFADLKGKIVDHRLNLDWDGLKLSIPSIPKPDKELQAAFEASVNGESRKILKQTK